MNIVNSDNSDGGIRTIQVYTILGKSNGQKLTFKRLLKHPVKTGWQGEKILLYFFVL